jgi:hypothetical protein
VRCALVLALLSACIDHQVEQRPPCQARLYSYDVTVEIDDSGHGCIELPPQCGRAFDLEQDVPGTQWDCTVIDAGRTLDVCDLWATNTPCWRTIQAPCGDTIELVLPDAPSSPSAYCTACLADWYRDS